MEYYALLLCAASDCSLLLKTKTAKRTEESGHCHQHDAEQHPTDPGGDDMPEIRDWKWPY